MNISYIIFLIVIPFIVIGILFVSWLIARFLCKPKRHLPNKIPADFDLPYQDINFRSGKTKIRGWFIPVSYSIQNKPVIILNHGWSSNSSRLLHLAKKFHNAGFSVLLYDSRGHGRSDSNGPITLLKFAEDIISAIDFLYRNFLIDYSGIGVFGHSMGGSAGILAASMDPRIKALVSCSAFDDPKLISTNFLRCLKIPRFLIGLNFVFINKWLGKPIESIAPINIINKITKPILLVHGSNDRIVSPKNLERLYQFSIKDRTKKLILPGRDHRNIIQDEEFAESVIMFFKKNLKFKNELRVFDDNTKFISNSKNLKYGT